MAQATESYFPIDRQTWSRLKREVVEFAKSEAGEPAKRRFSGLIALLLAISGLNVLNSYVGRDFFTAIENRNMSGFITLALLYIGVFAASTVAAALFRYTEERLGLEWRQWLTRQWVDGYLDRRAYYHLQAQGIVANPDQRISEDLRTFTVTTLSFALMTLNSTITVLAFSGVLWAISPTLFVVAVFYAAGGSFVSLVVGRRLVGLNYAQLDREAEFRLDLVHTRENAEAVALLHREQRLKNRMLRHLDGVVGNFGKIIRVNRNLNYFTNGYSYLSQIVPALVVAPLFIRGEVEFGVITQSAMAFAHLIGAFSLVVTNFQSLSTFAAVIARVGGLREGVSEALCAAEGCAEGMRALEFVDNGLRIAYANVTLMAPHNRHALLEDLSLAIEPGTRVLITGPNEEAKTALFRATAKVWETGSGRIERPRSENIYFLPEQPYLPPGTLRQLLVRTSREGEVPNEYLLTMLDTVGLHDLCKRAGGLDQEERNWDSLLSLAEQQRLALARLLLAKPCFAVLDRMRTSLNAEEVDEMLRLLNSYGITYITIGRARHGKRDSDDKLEDYDAELELLEDGRWQWRPVGR